MPKLWESTVATHRAAVNDAVMRTVGDLVQQVGVDAVTMSAVAEATGIGRATLYKYFPDLDTLLATWHAAQVQGHLARLRQLQHEHSDPDRRLHAVLSGYAHLSRHAHHGALPQRLHDTPHVRDAQGQLHALLVQILTDAALAGHIRQDTPVGELATYALGALSAAQDLPSEAATKRLIAVVLAGLSA